MYLRGAAKRLTMILDSYDLGMESGMAILAVDDFGLWA